MFLRPHPPPKRFTHIHTLEHTHTHTPPSSTAVEKSETVLFSHVCSAIVCARVRVCVCLIVSFSFILSPSLHILLPLSSSSSPILLPQRDFADLHLLHCAEKQKDGRKKHNRLVLFLILISSSKFDNYTFSPPHEFLCSVHIRHTAIDSAAEGSNY